MSAPPSLAEAQARIRALVTAPEGVASALEAAGDPRGEALSRLLRADRGLSPAERLGVYAHAFFERLRAALAKDFPDLVRTLGEDAFHDLVRVYLMLHPPRRPSIRDVGADLAAFLAEDESGAPFRRHLPCAPDIAAFEWSQTEVFDAPDAPLLQAETLAAVAAEDWPSLRLETVPALRVLRLDFPVHRLSEGDGRAQALGLERHETHVRVWRHQERVRWREIPAREAAALAEIRCGACFAAVCERIAAHVGDDAAAAEAAALLGAWIGDGCLRGSSRP